LEPLGGVMNFAGAQSVAARSALLAALTVVFAASAMSGASAQYHGNCSPANPPNPFSVAPGQSTSLLVFYYCFKEGDPNFQPDHLKIEIPNLPDGAKFTPPSTNADSDSSNGTTITINTSKDIKPGLYKLEVGGKGQHCTNYSVCYPEPFAVLEIKCDQNAKTICPSLWWFNGVDPQPDNYITKLEASKIEGQYTWTITDGDDYAQFVNGSNTIDTGPNANVWVYPKDEPPSSGQTTVSITVSVKTSQGTATSQPFQLTVHKPYSMKNIATKDSGNLSTGYESKLTYQVLDQYGDVLPQPIDMRENFLPSTANPQLIDDTTNNWPLAANKGYGGKASNPSKFTDTITGPALFLTYTPRASFPCTPTRCQNRVLHFCGYVTVGSPDEGKGVIIASLTWQKYTDHGRHCDLVSPAGSTTQPPSGCPGPHSANCPAN